jgi:3',5'-cyclic AMP phosphodiesterase CpdA
MKRIIHLSDLHFGRVNQSLVDPLLERVADLKPDLVAVSGDLTQRATERQFRAAQEFLRRIDRPKIIVPGNHDISLWNIYRRFFRPLDRYRRYIGGESGMSFADGELFALGVNTARSFAWKEGRISREQVEDLRDRFCALDSGVFKILVVHHPLAPREGDETHARAKRAELALEALEECNADLILAGHLHRGYSRKTAPIYRPEQHSILVVQSGTTLSDRIRGERNSFNVIDVAPDSVRIAIHTWEPSQGAFLPGPSALYQKRGEWRRLGN